MLVQLLTQISYLLVKICFFANVSVFEKRSELIN